MWHTRCDDDVGVMLFFPYPVEPTGCCTAHSKYSGKREHQCGDVVYVKTETKLFTQNGYIIAFSRGTSITIALASCTRERHV